MSQTPSNSSLPVTPGRISASAQSSARRRARAIRPPRPVPRRRRTSGSCPHSRTTCCRAARGRSRSSRRRGSRPGRRDARSPPAARERRRTTSAVQSCARKTPEIAAFTRSLVTGRPSSSRTPSPSDRGAAEQVARRCHSRLGCRLGPADPGELGARTSRAAGARRASGSGTSSTPAPRSRSAVEQRERRRGPTRCSTPSARDGADAISFISSAWELLVRRSSSSPNSSSGWST